MKGWKTITFSVLLALISIFSSDELRQHIGEHLEWYGPFTATAVAILRALTTSPIFKQHHE